MKNPPVLQSPSARHNSKVVSNPKQYVDVNDLRSLLKLALGLHTAGDPSRRLAKAADGLALLANADAWVIKAFGASTVSASAYLQAQLTGGRHLKAAHSPGMQVGSERTCAEASIERLIAAKHTPGRVLAVIDTDNAAVHTVLRAETSGRGQADLTLVSLYRGAGARPFIERERRIVELFHSHSAWLILQMPNE